MRRLLIPIALAAACGPASEHRVDGGTSDGPKPTGDAGVTTAACKVNKRTFTFSDGRRTETSTYFVPVAATPGSSITVVLCDPVYVTQPTACPAGVTCTDSGDPMPTGRVCLSVSGTFTYAGDTAIVNCGYETRDLNAAGTETSRSGQHYTSVEIRR